MSVNVNIIEEVPSSILTGGFDLTAALSSILTQFSQGTFGGTLTHPGTGSPVGTWVADGPTVPALDPHAAPVAAAPVAGVPVAGAPGIGAPVAAAPGAAPVAATPGVQPGVAPAGNCAVVPGAVAGPVPATPVASHAVALPCNVKVFGQDAQAPGTNRLLWSTSVNAQLVNGSATLPGNFSAQLPI